jgi:PKD repeat protein
MKKLLIKSLFFLTIFTALWPGKLLAQTITVGNVDPGPYAPGSSISVPISVTGNCVTTYSLYLSDASGSFANKVSIGTFSSFYATFVNGVIPAGTPVGSGYIVEVISANPSLTSSNSAAFTINAGMGVTAAVSSQLINPTYPEIFGTCIGVNNASYSFINKSTPGSTVTASFFNEQTQTTEGSFTPTTAGTPFTAKASQYTITVKAVNGGVVGTKSYLLINNSVNNSFGVTGSNTVCLSAGGILSYNVDITSASGVQNNFPGLIYTVKWGDGAVTLLTLCDIIAAGGKISHNYTTSSCGRNPNGQHNAFEVDLQPADLYCGNVGTQVTSYAQVITAPLNMFRSAIAACVNTPVTFDNLSDPGQDPISTTSDCKSSATLYTWIVDGKIAATNYSLTQNFQTTFTTTGTHSITLHLQNGNALCTASDTTQTICIQNAPQPKFTLPVTTGCAPLYITPINKSVIDVNCSSTNKYVWTVTGPGNVTYSNGTNNNSAQPQFVFHNPGAYTVQLGVTTVSCGTILAPVQILNIDSIAVAKLSPDTILCGSNQILNFNASRGETQTLLTGSSQNLPGTYSWKVTGGNYSFTGGTSDTSKYPQISFTDFATYSVSVSNSNTCGPVATAIQHITFRQAPTVSAGSVASFCANQSYTLNGSITGVYNNTLWEGGTGTFNPGRNTLNPVYSPSAAEVNAGKVTLTLAAFTSLSAPCDSIKSTVTLSITKPDSITSAPRDSVCSGSPINYQITAVAPNSSFTWTIDPNKTSASVSGYAANGKGTVINDVLVNSDPANYATVTYDITAVGGSGCSSNTFVLTVGIAPKLAVAKFTQTLTSGCDTVKVQFTNASTPSNSTFAWNFGDGSAISNAVSPSHTFFPRTDGKDTTYTVTLTLLARCGNPAPFTSSVTVRPKTPVAFISPKQITGCSPFTLAVDNFSPGTNQSYTYYLYDGATLVQQITVTDKSEVRFTPINVTSTKQFSLYMVATGYCGTTAQSTTIPITISASNIIAQMFIENGSNKGCAPFMVNFINNSLGADTYYYTIYDVNNKVVDRRQGGTAVQSYTFNTAGTFYVTITAANSCSTVESAPPLRVDVYPVPTPLFNYVHKSNPGRCQYPGYFFFVRLGFRRRITSFATIFAASAYLHL